MRFQAEGGRRLLKPCAADWGSPKALDGEVALLLYLTRDALRTDAAATDSGREQVIASAATSETPGYPSAEQGKELLAVYSGKQRVC